MHSVERPTLAQLKLSNIMHALSDPTRLKIIKYFNLHPQQPCSVLELPVAKSTRSQHFKVLQECGLISLEPRGVQKVVTVRLKDIEKKYPGLLPAIIKNL